MNIVYKTAGMEHLDGIAEIFSDAFAFREPMTASLHLTKQEAVDYMKVVCPISIAEGLSVVAFDEDVHRVAGFGVSFSKDLSCYPEVVGRLSEKILAGASDTEKVFEKLLEPLNSIESLTEDNSVTFMYMGMDADYRGNRISPRIAEEMEKAIRDRGFSYVICECTGPVSAKVMSDRGFETLSAIAYSGFGVPAFEGVPGKLTLMLKSLTTDGFK